MRHFLLYNQYYWVTAAVKLTRLSWSVWVTELLQRFLNISRHINTNYILSGHGIPDICIFCWWCYAVLRFTMYQWTLNCLTSPKHSQFQIMFQKYSSQQMFVRMTLTRASFMVFFSSVQTNVSTTIWVPLWPHQFAIKPGPK